MFLSASSLDDVTAIMFSAALEALQQLHAKANIADGQQPQHVKNVMGVIRDLAGCLGLQCDTIQPYLQHWQVGALALLPDFSRIPEQQEASLS
jgi:hypothetical protein